MRIRIGWGILVALMARTNTLAGLLMALVAMPLVAGCAVVGLPQGGAFDALPASGVGNDALASPATTPTFFSSNDGYALTLPPGWVADKTNNRDSQTALTALGVADAVLAAQVRTVLDETDARMSMIAIDGGSSLATGPVPTGMAVLMMSAAGGTDRETEQRVADVVDSLTVVDGSIKHSVSSYAAGDAHRFDMLASGDSLSVLVRVYLFTVGDDGVIVVFGCDPSLAAASEPDMDAIIKSLRFGI